MRIEVRSTDQLSGIVIHDVGAGEPQIVAPFKARNVSSPLLAEALDDREVLLVSERGGMLAVHDVVENRIVREYDPEAPNLTLVGLLRIGPDRVLLWNNSGLFVHRLDTLERVAVFTSIDAEIGRLTLSDPTAPEATTLRLYPIQEIGFAAEPKPHLIVTQRSDERFRGDGQVRYFVHLVDTRDWSVDTHLVETLHVDVSLNYLRAISPSGRYAIRSDYTTLPRHRGGVRGVRRFLRLLGSHDESPLEHPDMRNDGRDRYGINLDVWALESPPRVDRSITVRMVEPRDAVDSVQDHSPDPEVLSYIEEILHQGGERPITFLRDATREDGDFEKLARTLTALHASVADVAWEPDESAFWVRFTPATFRRVGLDGSLSPLIVFSRWADPKNPLRGQNRYLRPEMTFLPDGTLRIGRSFEGYVHLDPDRVPDGNGIVEIGPDEDGFEPVQRSAHFDHYAERTTRVWETLDALSADAASAAFDRLTARVRGSLRELVSGDASFRLGFDVAGEEIAEFAFFQQVVEAGLAPAVPALERLVDTYLDAIEGGAGFAPWADGEHGVAGLGPALRAIVLLDRARIDVYRRYLQKRDLEHEEFSLYALVPEYLEVHGWWGEPVVRFALYVVMMRYWSGHGGDHWAKVGVLDAAEERRLPAADLVDLFLEEIEAFDTPGQWDWKNLDLASRRAWFVPSLLRHLDTNRPYHDEVHAALAERLGLLLTRIEQEQSD